MNFGGIQTSDCNRKDAQAQRDKHTQRYTGMPDSLLLGLSHTHTHTHTRERHTLPFPDVPWIEFCKQYVTASTLGSAPPGMIIESTQRKAFSSQFPLRRLWFLGMRKACDKMLGMN